MAASFVDGKFYLSQTIGTKALPLESVYSQEIQSFSCNEIYFFCILKEMLLIMPKKRVAATLYMSSNCFYQDR